MRSSWRLRIAILLAMCCLVLLTGLASSAEQTIESQYGLYPDFAANWRVEYIGHRLARAAGLANINFRVFNEKDLNAMAVPDGRVYVTSRMATLVTDDELAFVLGHELTHLKEKHSQHQSQRVTGGAILGAVIAGVLGGSAGDIRTGADILGGLAYGHYSQSDEYRADKGGIRLMSAIGYDPKRAADAMQRLIDMYGRGDASTPVLGWFASHPDTKNRKDRLIKYANELAKSPVAQLPAPVGIDVSLDSSAEHAKSWAHTYLAILLADYGEGRAEVIPSGEYPVHALTLQLPTVAADKDKAQTATSTGNNVKDDGKNDKDIPLQPVKFTPPPCQTGYRVTVSLRQVPAGGAASLDAGEGTAVEAKLHWVKLASGFSGDCVAIDQHREKTPWKASEQLGKPDELFALSDGKSDNVEGTLEAIALRRATMAFAEILEADGPVDHSAPVKVTIDTAKLRQNDYIYVVRGNLIVAEVRVDQILSKKQISGTVLWGVHTWKKKDRFVQAES